METIKFQNPLINHIITTANAKENNFRKIHAAEQMIYNLAGDSNKDKRQAIYSELIGRKATKAESGVNNILAEMKKYIILSDETVNQAPAQPKQARDKLEDLLNELITSRENNLSVRSKTVILDKNSLANPRIQVGTIPYYDWQEDKRITYIICYGRFITCEMLVYEKMLNGYDYLKTQDQEEAKNYIKSILQNITNPKSESIKKPESIKQAETAENKDNNNVQIVTYSDKSVAIFGDTKPIKEKLKSIGAKFNPFLMYNGTKTAGWILPASKQPLLTNII